MNAFRIPVLTLLLAAGLLPAVSCNSGSGGSESVASTPAPGPGDLDPAFGDGGGIWWPAQVGIPGGIATLSWVNALVVRDGSLYVAGFDSIPGVAHKVWKLEKRDAATGALSPSFGVNGVLLADLGVDASARGVVIDGPSLFVWGTRGTPSGFYEGEWRIEKRSAGDGSLDAAFGSGGTLIPGYTVRQIVADPGSLYVAGSEDVAPTDSQWIVERRDPASGALVPSFGVAGRVASDPGPMRDSVVAEVIVAASLYVAGIERVAGPVSSTAQLRIEKYDPVDGTPDATFGTGGHVRTDAPYGIVPTDMVADGSALYISRSDLTSNVFVSVPTVEKRLQSTGAPDPAFGSAGVVVYGGLAIRGLLVDGGVLYAGGYAPYPGVANRDLTRVDALRCSDGGPETAFGQGGMAWWEPEMAVYTTHLPMSSDADGLVIGGNVYVDTTVGGNGSGYKIGRIERRLK